MSKPAVAIIIPGGIGTGRENIGVPVLEQTIKLLTENFSITVFQLYKTNTDYKAEGFELIEIHSSNPVIRMIRFFKAFVKAHRRMKFRAVHGFWGLPGGFLAVLAGKIFNIKSIVSLQGGDAIALPEIDYGQLVKPLSRKFALWTMHKANELVSPSLYCIKNLRRYGLRREDVRYIPLGIDTTLFRFNPKSISGAIKFIHIGNFNRVKDQETLLRAFQIIRKRTECGLTIIGEGELEDHIKSLTDKYSLSSSVTFQKPLPQATLVDYYHQSHILLLSSLSEGHPVVAEEAMSCGVLVCGTKVGLLYELDTCCVSVETGNYKELASSVLQLLADSSRIEELRDNARKWAESHSMAWTVKKFSELYQS
jgi:glycosyltransferase involved in cell wall biosynthesis